MQQTFPNLITGLQTAISQIEAELKELNTTRKAKKAELKMHQKALKVLNGSSGAGRKSQEAS